MVHNENEAAEIVITYCKMITDGTNLPIDANPILVSIARDKCEREQRTQNATPREEIQPVSVIGGILLDGTVSSLIHWDEEKYIGHPQERTVDRDNEVTLQGLELQAGATVYVGWKANKRAKKIVVHKGTIGTESVEGKMQVLYDDGDVEMLQLDTLEQVNTDNTERVLWVYGEHLSEPLLKELARNSNCEVVVASCEEENIEDLQVVPATRKRKNPNFYENDAAAQQNDTDRRKKVDDDTSSSEEEDETNASAKTCKCGSKSHLRTSFKLCRLNTGRDPEPGVRGPIRPVARRAAARR